MVTISNRFKTLFCALSKLVKQVKIYLIYIFKKLYIYSKKFYLENNLKI